MKKILFISVMIVALAVGYSIAQMGGGMMGGQQGQMGQDGMMGGGMMGGQQGQMGHGGMMQMMNQMGSMMQRMSGMMGKAMGTENMTKMQDLMEDMSEHMTDMSDMMGRSGVPQRDMQMLQQKMMETEKGLNMMKMK